MYTPKTFIDAVDTVDALVDAMVQVLVESGKDATVDDLRCRRFSRSDIDRHGPAAAAIARGRSLRQLAATSVASGSGNLLGLDPRISVSATRPANSIGTGA